MTEIIYNDYASYIESEKTLNKFAKDCHLASYYAGWWHNPDTGEEYETEGFLGALTIATKLGLIASEVFESMEGHRKQLMDDKLKDRPMIEVELVDALIRIFDLAGKLNLDLDGAYKEKMQYNSIRPDHKVEQRSKGGKLY